MVKRRRVMFWLYAALIVCVMLGGCTMMDGGESSSPSDAVAVRASLVARLAEIRQDQAVALSLWDRLIFGELVSCQESIPVPPPVDVPARDLQMYPDASAIQAQLNAAIQSLRDSADLWNIECAEARDIVPLSMAQSGRQAALAANDPLNAASALLSG